MATECYRYDGGFVIDPESDTKVITVILIGKQTVKCNPRQAVIYVAGGKVCETYEKLEEFKAYCEANKLVFICPDSADEDELGKTYAYVASHTKELNVLRENIQVRADAGHMEAAGAILDYALDEYDDELAPVEAFSL